jgi:hypothetical protein
MPRSLGDYQLAEPSPDLRKSAVQTTISRKPDEPQRRWRRSAIGDNPENISSLRGLPRMTLAV